MAEYRPKLRRKGLNPPFGYYPSKEDPNIMLPDVDKLEKLEHSFRMKAKHKTSIRDCCMWLQQNTGCTLTPAGYMYAYKRWVNAVRAQNSREFHKALKEKKAEIEKSFGEFTVNLDDEHSIYALAQDQATAS
jgi:hypothetical protein